MALFYDFAENYSYVIQNSKLLLDESPMYSTVVYCRKEDKLCHQSNCLWSDDTNHNVAIVREVQERSF